MNGRAPLAIFFTLLAATSVACATLLNAAGNQPNILLIQADDLGYDDLQFDRP